MDSKFWRIAELHLECIHVFDSKHSFPRHYHDSYVLEVVEHGVNEFWCSGKVYSARPREIIIIHPGEMHTGYAVGPRRLSYRALYPSKMFMKELCRQITGEAYLPRFRSNVIQDPALATSLVRMHSDLELMHKDSLAQSAITLVIGELIARHSLRPTDLQIENGVQPVPQLRMKRALDFVSEKFNGSISVSQLSTLCGISEFHFVREFKKMTGSAPYEYVVARRIEESKKLLSRGMTIAETATRTGFYDQSHFNRHFKRIVGITPGLYRSVSCSTS